MNRATELVDSWIANDEGLYVGALDAVRADPEDGAAQLERLVDDWLERFAEGAADLPAASMFLEMVSDAVGAVDWHELAGGMLETLGDEAEEEAAAWAVYQGTARGYELDLVDDLD